MRLLKGLTCASCLSGNLATKSLTPVVDPTILVRDSEYLETHLIVVPATARKDFMRSYETIAPMVVPRSALQIAQDDEFVLFAVTTFKKHSNDFLQKCREQKWTPRQYKYVEGGKEEERRELDRVAKEEKKIWGEALRMGRTGWSEGVMIWLHVLTLRVFVEAVLRYGLPLEYVSVLIQVRFCPYHPFMVETRCPTTLIVTARLRQNSSRRSSQLWTLAIRIWVGMRSGETRGAGSLKMTLPSRRKWRRQGSGRETARSTLHTYTTSSGLCRHCRSARFSRSRCYHVMSGNTTPAEFRPCSAGKAQSQCFLFGVR